MRSLFGVGLFVLVVGVIIWSRMSERGAVGDEVLAEMHAAVASLEVYPEHEEILDRAVDRAHLSAFDSAYDLGGRREAATFDDQAYLDRFFEVMIAEMKRYQKPKVVEALKELQTQLVLVEEEV